MLKKLLVLTFALVVVAFAGFPVESAVTSQLTPASALNFSDNTPDPITSLPINPFLMSSLGEQFGTTAYDAQRWDDGVRVAVDKDGNAHLTYMYYPLSGGTYNSRAIMYNVWKAADGEFAFPASIKVSGALRAGYPSIAVLADGRAVVAYHETEIVGVDTTHYCVVAIDEAPMLGAFSTKKLQVQTDKLGIWPDVKIGSDDVIHVLAQQSKNIGYDGSEIYYCRSTNKGTSFSNWTTIGDDAIQDGRLSVSPDGKKVAVLWPTGFKSPGSDTLWINFGNFEYRESTDGGATWKPKVIFTKDRYPDMAIVDDNFRIWGTYNGMSLTGTYDDKGVLHAIVSEGWICTPAPTSYQWIPRNAMRFVHWASDTKEFTEGVSGKMNIIPTAGDGNPWETPLDSFWGWGYITSPPTGANGSRPYMGCILPIMGRWGSNLVCVWQGQPDTLDISAAGYINMDIFVSVSGDYGKTWRPIDDFDSTDLGTYAAYFTNLTNTHTPDAGPGACDDEGSVSIWPIIGTDNKLHITYIEDKFAETFVYGDPTQTDNPVKYLAKTGLKVGKNTDEGGVEESTVSASGIELVGSGPFTGSVTFKINAPAAKASLNIYDAAGALVGTVVSGNVRSGNVSWNASDVPAGVYFYSFSTSAKTSTGRLVVIH